MIKAPKGTKDMLPGDSHKWHHAEDVIRRLCAAYGYREIRTPIFEHTELFIRGVGDTTDIVQKEMYTFMDKGDRSITLKPEGTAGVVRAFIEHGLYAEAQPTKMYYLSTPVFRYENPQQGRLRQHHQFGVEVFGTPSAAADAEIISLAMNLFKSLGVGGLELNINSIGCPECRREYNAVLRKYLAAHETELCNLCRDRLERNPLRILDCKEERCGKIAADAPKMLDHLCEGCAEHFERLQEYLTALGLEFVINPTIVRGLDYYTKTVFEIIAKGIGAQGTVCGGGRYDGLIEQCGGPSMPGVGFGLGMERLLMVCESQGIVLPEPSLCDVFICLDAKFTGIALRLANELRALGVKTDLDTLGRSFKAQFKNANRLNAAYAAVIGEQEAAYGEVKVRDMAEGEEKVFALETAAADIAALLAKANASC